MLSRVRQLLSFSGREITVTATIAVFALCGLAYLLTKSLVVLAIPFVLLALIWGLKDFRRLYFLIWATIPFAIEIDLPGGLSTDFPAEPLMWMTCFMLPAYFYLYHKEIDFRFIFHPLFIILVIHFFWIILTSVISTEPMMSFKYTLAKSWYLICFVLIPLMLFRTIDDFKTWGLYYLIPLVGTILIIIIRHSQYGFTFATINYAVIPIYRNHVDYASTMAIVLPYLWILRKWFTGFAAKAFLYLAIVLLVAGIYFSFTRAAWLCIPLAVGLYFTIRLRLMRAVIPVALAIVLLIVGWMAYDNRYLDFSPDYEKTITHKQFDDLVSATYKMEDISTVERFYRWVAGFYMIKEKPLTGFGPASFYSHYHSYVDRHFITYVSDNPEHSGMHNYYLMVAVEQGLIGLGIFIILIIAVLVLGERLYHQMKPGPRRSFLMAALVSFGCNLFILTLNDMVETDKLGSFFFLSIAVVILFTLQENTRPQSSSEG